MGAQLRVYRQKIHSAESTKKITRAMELISASRIQKAREAAEAARPYAEALNRAVAAVASRSASIHHPLIGSESRQATRSAVVVISSDRGMAGAFAANVAKTADRLSSLLRSQGKQVDYYLVGRKIAGLYSFRHIPVVRAWTGWTDHPDSAHAHEIGQVLEEAFLKGGANGGVDEIHVVYTKFVSMIAQVPTVLRLFPLEVVEDDAKARHDLPLYEFEPDEATVLDALLPRYIDSELHSVLLDSAAAKHAATQTAMHSASENADQQVYNYTRLMNTARQTEITQQITEIVGGADALSKQTD